jgi:hypothetical protein
MEVLLLLVAGALNIACFFIGAKVGQTAAKGETLELPAVDPMKPIREHRERKEAERKSERYDTIMRNIDSYDGTGIGQEDVPRG